MYNYFEIRDKIRADSSYRLPIDINAPIRDEFKDYSEIIAWIDQVEKHLQVRRFEMVLPKKAHIRIVLQADKGMIEGYDKITIINTEKNMSDYLHIKNKNLSKKREQNERPYGKK
jgi:hypothetical protein